MGERESTTRRRILARKAVLASLAGLTGVGGAGACAHEPQTVTVEPVAASSPSASAPIATASARPTATAARRPPPRDDDEVDALTVGHPMHGSDPVGPPVVLPRPPPWSTFLPELSVSSKASLSKGRRVVVITMVIGGALELGPPPYPAVNVVGGTIVKPTWLRDEHGKHVVVVTIEPTGTAPVQVTLTVVEAKSGRRGHALFDVPGARSGAIGRTVRGKVLRLAD